MRRTSRTSLGRCFAVVVVLLTGATPSPALMIPGLYDTGVDDAGMPLAPGQRDLHYQLTGPASPAYALVPNPRYLVPVGARWIGPGADGSGLSTDPDGEYVYTLSFDLSGIDLPGLVIAGGWTSDNASSILLNGAATGFSAGIEPYGALLPFRIDGGFVAGLNTLEFLVTNEPGASPNPSSLLVSGLTAVPEPTTAWLLLLELVSLSRASRATQRR